jgi:hypothetical protein
VFFKIRTCPEILLIGTRLDLWPEDLLKVRAEQDPPRPAPIFTVFEVIYAGTSWILSNPCGAGHRLGFLGPAPHKKT